MRGPTARNGLSTTCRCRGPRTRAEEPGKEELPMSHEQALYGERLLSPPPLSLSLSLCDLPEGSYVKKPSNLLARARTSVSVCAVYV